MPGFTSLLLAKARHIGLVASRRGNMTSDGLRVPPLSSFMSQGEAPGHVRVCALRVPKCPKEYDRN